MAIFREQLINLFIKGYVTCEPEELLQSRSLGGTAGLDGASGTSRATRADGVPFTTLTQIAIDQCRNSVTVKVGHRERRLPDMANERTALSVMKEVQVVAKDVLRRIDADFHDENSLYLSFEALDLCAWNTVAKCCRTGRLAATSVDDAHQESKKSRLTKKARRLHNLCKLEFIVDDFLRAVDVALRCRDHLPNTVAEHWRNRVAWAEALASAQGPSPGPHARYVEHLEPVLRFYWSCRDGTGDVERSLGRLVAMQKSHCGGRPTGEIDFIELCVELHEEGPKCEEEVAAREGWSLLLTEHSRRCAELWLTLHGRRFACSQQRVDQGVRHPESRQEGSFSMVKKRTARALDSLCLLAEKDKEDPEAAKRRRTIFGFHRSRLDQNRAEPPEPNKKIQAFRRHTERTLQEKGQRDVWDGFSFKPLVQRRKGQAAGTLKRHVAWAGRHLKRQAARKEPSASAAARGKAAPAASRAMGKPAPAASRGEAAASAVSRSLASSSARTPAGTSARKNTHTHTQPHTLHTLFFLNVLGGPVGQPGKSIFLNFYNIKISNLIIYRNQCQTKQRVHQILP